jgi:hypothetical protein
MQKKKTVVINAKQRWDIQLLLKSFYFMYILVPLVYINI